MACTLKIELISHWTYWHQILSELCFHRVAFSDKNTSFNDLEYKADIGQHFHISEKSARRRHRYKIIKTNLKTLVSPLLIRPKRSQGCQKMGQDPLKMPAEVWCAKIAPKLKNIWKTLKNQGFFDIFSSISKMAKFCPRSCWMTSKK